MTIDAKILMMVVGGIFVGIGASFTGLGGGFLMIPFLLFLGYSAQMAVGTSFLAILLISISAVIAHDKLANVDYKLGFILGIGGIIGAQIGAQLIEHVPTHVFRRLFACILIGISLYLFFKK
jgi:uncharacterized membrane protein YfcA